MVNKFAGSRLFKIMMVLSWVALLMGCVAALRRETPLNPVVFNLYGSSYACFLLLYTLGLLAWSAATLSALWPSGISRTLLSRFQARPGWRVIAVWLWLVLAIGWLSLGDSFFYSALPGLAVALMPAAYTTAILIAESDTELPKESLKLIRVGYSAVLVNFLVIGFYCPYFLTLNSLSGGQPPLLSIIIAYAIISIAMLVKILLTPGDILTYVSRLRATSIWLIWLFVLVYVTLGLQIGDALTQNLPLAWAAPFYLWIIVCCALLLVSVRRGHPQTTNKAPQYVAVALSCCFAALSIARDAAFLYSFSWGINPDTCGYVSTCIGSKTSSMAPLTRTPPYVLLNSAVGTQSNPWNIIGLQVLLSAFTLGLLVYVIARKNLLASVIVGFLAATSLAWASVDRMILTESIFVSFHILCLCVLIYHYDRRDMLRWWELVGAGTLYMWTFLIRPSELLLIIPVGIAYLWFAKNRLQCAWLLVGVIIMTGAFAAYNLNRLGELSLSSGGNGIYASVPLFRYHLFSPDNGPHSRQLDKDLRSCKPGLDYADYSMGTSNYYLWQLFVPCLAKISTEPNYGSTLFINAYFEAVAKRWGDYINGVLTQSLVFVSEPTQVSAAWHLEPEPYAACIPNTTWCDQMATRYRLDVTKVASFLKPFMVRTQPLMQIQFAVVPYKISPIYGDKLPSVSPAAALLMTIVFLTIQLQGSERLLVVASAVFIGYLALSVTAAGYVEFRYIVPVVPIYCLLSGLFIALVIGQAWRTLHLPAFVEIPWVAGAISAVCIGAACAFIAVSVYLISESHHLEFYRGPCASTLNTDGLILSLVNTECPQPKYSVDPLPVASAVLAIPGPGGTLSCGAGQVTGFQVNTFTLTLGSYPACQSFFPNLTVLCLNDQAAWGNDHVSNISIGYDGIEFYAMQDGICGLFPIAK
jgi:hypothetical protein